MTRAVMRLVVVAVLQTLAGCSSKSEPPPHALDNAAEASQRAAAASQSAAEPAKAAPATAESSGTGSTAVQH
jgi:predicted small lipoprotein YifL